MCKGNRKVETFISNRSGLRNHMKEEHFIRSEIANKSHSPSELPHNQTWWITEEM